MEFEAFPKIPRVSKALECVITEKIDGSNAQILITHPDNLEDDMVATVLYADDDCELALVAGSRKRWVFPEGRGPKGCDNFGFAQWVSQNAGELIKLGEGRHFGEWYGSGIQCGYGLTNGEKRFALFNARRWTEVAKASKAGLTDAFPSCCEVVPVLYEGPYSASAVDDVMEHLDVWGSRLVPGFRNPEGIIIEMNRQLMKHTFNNPEGKWKLDASE